jgi:hypothetical protein
MPHKSFADLDEMVLLCHDEKARSYLVEAIASYKAGAMRASIISAWIAVCFDFIDKVRQLELQGDAAAAVIAKKLHASQQGTNFAEALAFERDILENAWTTLGLISNSEHKDLSRLYEDRHRCAHPSMNADGEIFQPTAEQVRYHIRTAVMTMLSQPATSGKASLEQLVLQVKGEFFPTEKAKASVILEKGLLAKPRPALVRNFIVVLIKIMLTPASTSGERTRSAAALNSLRTLHSAECHSVLGKDLSPLLRGVADPDYGLVVAMTSRLEDSLVYVDADIRTRMEQYVTASSNQPFAAISELALAVPSLVPLVEARLANFSTQDFQMLVTARPQLMQLNSARERAVSSYRDSGSFDQANANADRIIIPFSQLFSLTQISMLVEGGFENGQIRFSFRFTPTMLALRENSQIDPAWWDALIAGVDPENAYMDLRFGAVQAA